VSICISNFIFIILCISRINCNVDVIVSGVNIINKLNISSPNPIGDKEMLNGFEDLYEAFVHFFSRGAPAERFMANEGQ